MNKLFFWILAAALAMVTAIWVTEAVASDARQLEKARADSLFEVAVGIIKKYETMHQPRHWPFVGYGHRVLAGEKFDRKKTLDEKTADALLRKDLRKNMHVFSKYGKDSMLLGVLAYNIGMGNVMKSSIVKKLKAGDRDIRSVYISYNRYKGKAHKGIRRRRTEEFDKLFISDTASKTKTTKKK